MDKNYDLEKQKGASFGLIGKNISYSFSKQYFTEKFLKLKLYHYDFEIFDIDSIEKLPVLLKENPNLKGLSVTIPYKEEVINMLDDISEEAKTIGAVNSIRVKNGKLKGFNTDVTGFEKTFKQSLKQHHKSAIILGTGGASKAVKYVLNQLSIPFIIVSRNPKNTDEISYNSLSEHHIKTHQIIINCTPVGTFPAINEAPSIPYQYLTKNHYLFDLIYNPSETLFLKKGKEKGATIMNGFDMLEIQAEKSWEIWQSA